MGLVHFCGLLNPNGSSHFPIPNPKPSPPNYAPPLNPTPPRPPWPPPLFPVGPLQGPDCAGTADAAETAAEAAELHVPGLDLGGPVQLDVEPGRQGGHAAHGRIYGAGGEVHGGCHVRHRAAPVQAPVRDGLSPRLRPLHPSPPLGPLVGLLYFFSNMHV